MKKHSFFSNYKALLMSFWQGMPRYLKYQAVTKLLLSVVILPLFWVATQVLMQTRGISAVSNSQLFKFLMSPQGIVFMLMGATIVLLSMLMEIGGFICLSTQIIHNQKESSYQSLLKLNLRQLPQMLEFGSLLILLYLLLLAPMSGTGVTLSFFESLEIPAFINGVIESNTLYMILYTLASLLMLFFSIKWMFTFHFIIIGKFKPSEAIRASGQLIKRHWKRLGIEVAGVSLTSGLILLVGVILWFIIILGLSEFLNFETSGTRIGMMFMLLLQEMGLVLGAILFIPFEVHHFTILFYEFVENDPQFSELRTQYPRLSPKKKPSLLDKVLNRKKTLVALTILTMIALAVPTGIFFREIYSSDKIIEVMGHRGGGIEGPENTLLGIQKSIDNGADWVELDIQRTKDGVYVLNHDDDFKRVAGDNRYLVDMTYAEVKALDVGRVMGEKYAGERVPTLEEVLDYCRGKIKLNLELKGKAADEKMLRDVVAMVRGKRMVSQVLLTSLDYKMVERIEKDYPTFKSGFIYFLAFGQVENFKADYLILEEREAKEETIAYIHEAGKKVVVWTVNDEDAMAKFVKMDIDGIITDDVKRLNEVILERDEKDERDLFLDAFFEGLSE